MAIFYLVRHGSNDFLGKALAGRLPGVHLNEQGRQEADRLAKVLGEKGIQRIISSPMERACQTAEPLASRTGLPLEIHEEFLEVDFGEWNGLSMEELGKLEEWKRFNVYRSGCRVPGGELAIEIQARFVRKLESLRAETPDGVFAIFSHGDPIRAALCYYMGIPLDFLTRFEVSPGSYSILRLELWGPQILGLNLLP